MRKRRKVDAYLYKTGILELTDDLGYGHPDFPSICSRL